MSIEKLEFKPGDPLRAEDLQMIVDELVRPGMDVRGDDGIDVRRGPRGQLQFSLIGKGGHVAVATGDITARSGSTWGTGQVTVYNFNGTDDYTAEVTYDVFNPSSTTMKNASDIDTGIADGVYCWIEPTQQGWWIVSPLECEAPP